MNGRSPRQRMGKRLNNPRLRRFWFEIEKGHGVGVTAYSIDDARGIIKKEASLNCVEIIKIIEDIDIRSLDSGHVIPNIGPVNFRGIWYPNLIH